MIFRESCYVVIFSIILCFSGPLPISVSYSVFDLYSSRLIFCFTFVLVIPLSSNSVIMSQLFSLYWIQLSFGLRLFFWLPNYTYFCYTYYLASGVHSPDLSRDLTLPQISVLQVLGWVKHWRKRDADTVITHPGNQVRVGPKLEVSCWSSQAI